jgi:hypothetical protein
VCNLYSITKGQQAIWELSRAMSDRTGNMPLLQASIPTTERWGMPSPLYALKGKKSDPGVTNVRRRLASLAPVAWGREPVPRPLHKLCRKRASAGRPAPAGVVRIQRNAPARRPGRPGPLFGR